MKSINFRPQGDRIAVKEVNSAALTESGLHLPPGHAEKDRMRVGDVVALGPGLTTPTGAVIPPQVSLGDRVVFEHHNGTKIKLNDDTTLTVVHEHDVLCAYAPEATP